MKRFVGLAFSAGLVLAASATHAQTPAPNDAGRSLYRPISDFDGPYERPYSYGPPPAYEPPPYAEPAPVPPAPVYGYGGGYDDGGGYGPPLLPLPEVYAVLRDNGFSPLGAPHLHGLTYAIAAMDPRGAHGRLVIDARNGRILRFEPSYGYGPYGENFAPERMSYPEPEAALPPRVIYGSPRPPAPVPHVASHAVPLPSPKPAVAARPPEPAQPPQRSAAIEPRPAAPPATPPSAPPPSQANASPAPQPHTAPAPTVGEAKPMAARPDKPMPPVQGFE